MRLPRAIEELTERLRHDLPRKLPWLDRRIVVGSLALVVGAVLVWAISAGPLSGDDSPQVETRVVTIAVETDDAAGAPVGPLGFPQLATRNTTRVGGPDPASDAAAIALATHPRSSLAGPVEAAVLVDGSSAYAGIAASVLAGPPIRAPILIGG
ncbi:MAG: hypothetical protein M3M99_00380, partial [Actinomycetota bacterium]|nr:hypothetical protein [Actinomycetota bacterium]